MPDLRSAAIVAVHAALDERRMSQREGAGAMGISEQAFSDKLRGRRRFTIENLERLARYLGITLSQLLEPPALLVDEDESEQR